jgi:hypothetical protein
MRFGEENIWTKGNAPRAQISFSIGCAPAFKRKHAQSVEGAALHKKPIFRVRELPAWIRRGVPSYGVAGLAT